MLILCSNGLTSAALLQAVRQQVQGSGRAALVVTADYEYKEKNYHVPRCISELESMGLTAVCFDLDEQRPELLLDYDVVEFIGGNPFYLLDCMRKCDCKKVLQRLAQEKVLIGWSAGALVMGPSLELVNRYSPEMNFLNLTDLTAMELTEREVLPHYDKFLKRYDRFEEKCAEYERELGKKVIRLNDGGGVIIDWKTAMLWQV